MFLNILLKYFVRIYINVSLHNDSCVFCTINHNYKPEFDSSVASWSIFRRLLISRVLPFLISRATYEPFEKFFNFIKYLYLLLIFISNIFSRQHTRYYYRRIFFKLYLQQIESIYYISITYYILYYISIKMLLFLKDFKGDAFQARAARRLRAGQRGKGEDGRWNRLKIGREVRRVAELCYKRINKIS